jgi:hypothetical protein
VRHIAPNTPFSEKSANYLEESKEFPIFAAENYRRLHMNYSEIAQLELLNALNSIKSEAELNEFKSVLAHYFAMKAQKAIDKLWDEGVINEETIEKWGEEHMRTPYSYETHRS